MQELQLAKMRNVKIQLGHNPRHPTPPQPTHAIPSARQPAVMAAINPTRSAAMRCRNEGRYGVEKAFGVGLRHDFGSLNVDF